MKTSILVSALLLLTLCGCGSRTPPERERRFGKEADPQDEKSDVPPPMYVELPKGWQPRRGRFGGGPPRSEEPPAATSPTAALSADLSSLDAHFRLEFQPQAESGGDLAAWVKARKQATAEKSALTNRQETELIPSQIAGHDVLQYEITGKVAGIQGRTRVFFLSVGTWFCQLTCWTTPANWATAQPKFEELIGRIRLGPPPATRTPEPAPKKAPAPAS